MTCTVLGKITGGVKFFEKNKALYKDGNTVSASTGDEASKYIIDINQYTRWESVNSNDLTIESITINLKFSSTIDRILLLDHNFKEFTIQYNGTTDFTNVVGLDALLPGGISETTFSDNSAYYEFDPVLVSNITITVTKTQVADQDKYLTTFIATEEIGTLAGFPRVADVGLNRNIRSAKALSGKTTIQKSYETIDFRLQFKTYPIQADIDIIDQLHDIEESFMVWLCGGRRGPDHFTIEQRGWRLKDVYHMQIPREVNSDYEKGIYQNGVNKTIAFTEVIPS